MERPLKTIRIRDWSGLVSNRGRLAIKPGDAQVQRNVRALSPGVLETRGGIRKLNFSN